jgi:membrane-associated phospholipid phosphatase
MIRDFRCNNAVDALRMWNLITRLGAAQIVLPLALATALTRVRSPGARPLALRWLILLSLAVLVTTASKVAFIGWGFGSAELNFTGVSGHTMLAAAVYPLLLPALTCTAPKTVRYCAFALGCAIAFLVGISRVVLGAHSVSEIVAGWLVGGAVCAGVLARGTPMAAPFDARLPVVVALWLSFMAAAAPPLNTHSIVTRLALELSGRAHPYTRSAMLRELRLRQGLSTIGARPPLRPDTK